LGKICYSFPRKICPKPRELPLKRGWYIQRKGAKFAHWLNSQVSTRKGLSILEGPSRAFGLSGKKQFAHFFRHWGFKPFLGDLMKTSLLGISAPQNKDISGDSTPERLEATLEKLSPPPMISLVRLN